MGHLLKLDGKSDKAWLYGKLLVAPLTDKIVRHARTISPWGYDMQAQHMERLQVRAQPSHTCDLTGIRSGRDDPALACNIQIAG